MRTRRSRTVLVVAAVVAAGLSGPASSAGAQPSELSSSASAAGAAQPSGPSVSYVVLAGDASQLVAARRSATDAGGTVVASDPAIGSLTVTAPSDGYLEAIRGRAGIAGAAKDRAIGASPGTPPRRDLVEGEAAPGGERGSSRHRPGHRGRPGSGHGVPAGTDTFEDLQWDMQMIRADVARTKQAGDPGVLVGIMDTGVDGSHPDLAANLDTARSRNFTTDIPDIDGPCEVASCIDPADVDDGGHGTHVAGTVAAAANGTGIVGVAPRTTLVNVRAGQDSGYFFLAPTLDALIYSADIGIDVVNMSFYVDPWLFNCRNNPADSAEAQYEQRTIITAVNRATTYANNRGVTLISAMGNEHIDIGKDSVDLTSPDYPDGSAYSRLIDNDDCFSLPTEASHVYGVTSVGPSTTKADYSSYGLEHAWVAAPGGWFRDGFGTETFRTNGNLILSTYPLHVLQEEGSVDADGNVVPEAEGLVFRDCTSGGACGYYTYLQGTSMASPHAAGVAALAVSEAGKRDRAKGGLTLRPERTADLVARSATPHACPTPRLQEYLREGRDASFSALCEGSTRFNGFYGHGIIDAAGVVRAGR